MTKEIRPLYKTQKGTWKINSAPILTEQEKRYLQRQDVWKQVSFNSLQHINKE